VVLSDSWIQDRNKSWPYGKERTTHNPSIDQSSSMQIELSLEERKKKSTICINGNNGNGSHPVLINQIHDEDPYHIEAIKGNGYRHQANVHTQQQQQQQQQQKQQQQHLPNRNNGTVKCTHFEKPGHTVERCFVKFLGLRNHNQSGKPKIKQTKTKQHSKKLL
jgi:hypothetical protein